MAERENFFFLLNLSYDPPESDPDVIKKAIGNFRRQIESDARIPGREESAAARRALVPELQRVMNDPVLRQKEAAQAKAQQGKILDQLRQEIQALSAAGYMTPEERDGLEKKYAAYGISKELLNTLLKDVKIGNEAPDPGAQFPEQLRQQLEAHLEKRNYPYRSLYDFLGKPESTPTANMLAATKKRADDIVKAVSPQQKDIEDSSLCDLCLKIFADEQTRKLYDKYLQTHRYLYLNKWVLSQAKKTGNVMTPQLLDSVLALGAQQYPDISKLVLQDYLQAICRENGIAFPFMQPPPQPRPTPPVPDPPPRPIPRPNPPPPPPIPNPYPKPVPPPPPPIPDSKPQPQPKRPASPHGTCVDPPPGAPPQPRRTSSLWLLPMALAYIAYFVFIMIPRVHWMGASFLTCLRYFLPVLFWSVSAGFCTHIFGKGSSLWYALISVLPVGYYGYGLFRDSVYSFGTALIALLFIAVTLLMCLIYVLPGFFIGLMGHDNPSGKSGALVCAILAAAVLAAGTYVYIGPATFRTVDTEDMLAQAKAAEQSGDARAAAAAYWLAGEYETSRDLCDLNALFGEDWAILPDGSVSLYDDDFDVSHWVDVSYVCSVGSEHFFGLTENGSILMDCNHNSDNAECFVDTASWREISQFLSWEGCLVGLRTNGTVICSGELPEGVSFSHWTDVSQLIPCRDWLIGLRSSGGMYIAGSGELPLSVEELGGTGAPLWADTVLKDGAICVHEDFGSFCVFAVTESGKLLYDDSVSTSHGDIFAGQTDVVQVCSTKWDALILKADGSVLGFGFGKRSEKTIAQWTDVIYIDGKYSYVGMRSNGSLELLNLAEPIRTTPVVAIAPYGYGAVCLHIDGTLTVLDDEVSDSYQEWLESLNLFASAPTQEGG